MGFYLEGRHRPKPLSSPDLESPEEILQFFEGLAELLKEKLTPANSKVHLCISGGRKSMAYAADLAVQKVAAELGEEVTDPRLTVWHVQLSRDEEPRQEEVELLLDHYRTGSVSERDRQQKLYPSNAKVFTIPYFHFASSEHVETRPGLRISQKPSFVDKLR
jgi:hypothetical protein